MIFYCREGFQFALGPETFSGRNTADCGHLPDEAPGSVDFVYYFARIVSKHSIDGVTLGEI
jgi:hypothetical protein